MNIISFFSKGTYTVSYKYIQGKKEIIHLFCLIVMLTKIGSKIKLSKGFIAKTLRNTFNFKDL